MLRGLPEGSTLRRRYSVLAVPPQQRSGGRPWLVRMPRVGVLRGGVAIQVVQIQKRAALGLPAKVQVNIATRRLFSLIQRALARAGNTVIIRSVTIVDDDELTLVERLERVEPLLVVLLLAADTDRILQVGSVDLLARRQCTENPRRQIFDF